MPAAGTFLKRANADDVQKWLLVGGRRTVLILSAIVT
jgi:hypothetical protein